MKQLPYHIVIIGPQGSGKGTQAELLAEHYNLVHVEAGKLLRTVAKQSTPLGRKIDTLINKQGRLVPSSLINHMIQDRVDKVSRQRGIIFDGFPRNATQARALDRVLQQADRQLSHVFYLPISRQTTIKRLAARRTCRRCGRVFIDGIDFPAGTADCPTCKSQLYQREDDMPRAIAQRLAIFNKQTKPVLQYYRRKGLLITVDGEPPIQEVYRALVKQLDL